MTPLGAANAYASVAQQIGQAAKPQSALDATGGAGPTDFARMVTDALNDVTAQAQRTDQVNVAAVTGEADLVDVVTAVSETELTMDTLVGLRDRVIGAYEQIMRMPI